MRKIQKIIEILIFVIVNVLISALPVLFLSYDISNWLIMNIFHADALNNDWMYLVLFLIFWPLYIIAKICLFPFLYSQNRFFPNIHRLLDKINKHRKLTNKFTICMLLSDVLLYILSCYLFYKVDEINMILTGALFNLLLGGGISICYLAFYIWIDTRKQH